MKIYFLSFLLMANYAEARMQGPPPKDTEAPAVGADPGSAAAPTSAEGKAANSAYQGTQGTVSGGPSGPGSNMNGTANNLDRVGYTTSDKARKDYNDSVRATANSIKTLDNVMNAVGVDPAQQMLVKARLAPKVDQSVGKGDGAARSNDGREAGNGKGSTRGSGGSGHNSIPALDNDFFKGSMDTQRAARMPELPSEEHLPSQGQGRGNSVGGSGQANSYSGSGEGRSVGAQMRDSSHPLRVTERSPATGVGKSGLTEQQVQGLMQLAIDGLIDPKNPEGVEQTINFAADRAGNDPVKFLSNIGVFSGIEDDEAIQLFAGELKTVYGHQSASETLKELRNLAINHSRDRISRYYAAQNGFGLRQQLGSFSSYPSVFGLLTALLVFAIIAWAWERQKHPLSSLLHRLRTLL